MSFSSATDYTNKVVTSGQFHTTAFRKTPANATTAGIWCDLSMSPGAPVNNFFFSTPLTAATLVSNEGIYHGGPVTPAQKYLKRVTVMANSALLTLQVIDVLLYYPAIDGDSTEEQTLINSVALSRYTTGAGVLAYLVSQGAYTGGNQFFITYTNQDGTAGRISPVCTMNTAGTYGTLASAGTSAGTFGWSIPLAYGDTGIRSVQSVTFLAAGGGIFSLVLCVPLGAAFTAPEANIPSEKDFFLDHSFNMPEVVDGAFLSFLACPGGSLAAVPVYGTATFVWG